MKTYTSICVLVLTFLAACASRPLRVSPDETVAEVERAMERYMTAARAVDADAIAACFTDDGVLFEPGIEPVVSSKAIREFIASFPGVKVVEATTTIDTVELFGDTAFLWGSYFERLEFPGQPPSAQHGRFVAEWKRVGSSAWRLHRLFRVPVS
ncbi:MAG: nuclear transport factor 2 family protein [Planctomycetes bacterium]|nr:nuclear transport factor 2 family protein [Planctomycetota bacterium]